jgi:hypothetical protein
LCYGVVPSAHYRPSYLALLVLTEQGETQGPPAGINGLMGEADQLVHGDDKIKTARAMH